MQDQNRLQNLMHILLIMVCENLEQMMYEGVSIVRAFVRLEIKNS